MRRAWCLLLAASCLTTSLFFLPGCATIIHGTRQNVQISSDPSGATVLLDSTPQGTTPLVLGLKRNRNHTIVINPESWNSYVDVSLKRKFSRWSLGNIIFLSLSPAGLLVDWLSGGLYNLSSDSQYWNGKNLHVTLRNTPPNDTAPGPDFWEHLRVSSVGQEWRKTAATKASDIPKPTVPPRLATQVSFKEPSGNNMLDAGETGTLAVSVTNSGKGPAYGVNLAASVGGVSGIAVPAMAELGEIGPGKTQTQSIALESSQELANGRAQVKIEAHEANGFDASPKIVEFKTQAFKAPRLEVSAVSIGGGVVRAGEVTQVDVTVKNSGNGLASNVVAALEIKSADIFASGDATVILGTLEPGRSARALFDFVVNMRFRGKELPLALNVTESWGKYGADLPLNLALGEPAPLPQVLTVEAKVAAPQASTDTEALGAPPYRLTARPADFAIVIGIDKYQSLPVASYADRDATAVRSHLIAMGFPKKNIIFLTRDKATKSSFMSYFEEWLPKNVQPESKVFVYFSGHGAPDPESGDAYLVPWDGNPQFLQSTAYSLKQLFAALGRLKAKEVTVALDACFSGAGGRSVLAQGARPLVVRVNAGQVPGGNLTVFSAASGEQITGALEEAEYGIFTYHFLKGLRGGARDSSGQITAKGLFDYLTPHVQEDARRQNREQTPGLSGAGERVLVRLEH
ncbi:MAG: caspase family protein [Elusimicrobia bacterium]|nr:caspase family protein [Elusimicrobiota bacterium]